MKKILLHVCCANCAVVPIELLKDKFKISLFWYNPNIHPAGEYQKRLADVERLATIYRVELVRGEYDQEQWFNLVKGLEGEPEGGQRCRICFQMRLEKTARLAQTIRIPYFATSLTVGTQKNARIINQLGKELAEKYGLEFFAADFKKKDGFKKSVVLSKKYNFYRQNYCGCLYSQKR